jgi:hypothetical protein
MKKAEIIKNGNCNLEQIKIEGDEKTWIAFDENDVKNFGDWLGFHYYRVSGWKWRQIKDESDTTEYTMSSLFCQWMQSKWSRPTGV